MENNILNYAPKNEGSSKPAKRKFSDTDFGKKFHKLRGKTLTKFQNLARVIVFPIAVLPIAGIFLGIGGGLAAAASTNYWGQAAIEFFTIIKTIGNIVFASLGLLFATSIAFGYAKASKGVAAVAGFIAFASMEVTMSALFLPGTNTAGDAIIKFDPYKLAGDFGIISVGENKGMLKSVMGISPTLDLSVLGGILVGWLTAIVHNRTYDIKVPRVLSFFGGERFVPIATFLMGVAMGAVLFFTWPILLIALSKIGAGLGVAMNGGTESGNLANTGAGKVTGGFVIAFIFGFIERMLIPAGLHHVFYAPFWYTSAGGQWLKPVLNGDTITGWSTTSGSYNIFFDQMNFMGKSYTMTDDALNVLKTLDGGRYWNLYQSQISGNTINYNHFTMEVGTIFSSGRFSFMQYGYPFAAVAMIILAKPENRARTAGIIGSAAATSFLTGITEPMLFSFLFVAPLLWVFHAGMAGISFALAYTLNVNVGQGFAAGFIDYSFFGLLPGYSTGTNNIKDTFQGGSWQLAFGRDGALWIPLYGLGIMAPSYFFGFYGIIKAKDYKTPGREDGGDDKALSAVQASLAKGTKNAESKEEQLIKGFGGKDNIVDISENDKSVTVVVKNAKKINEAFIKTAGIKKINVNDKEVEIPTDEPNKLWTDLDKAFTGSTSSKKEVKSDKKAGSYSEDFLQLIIDGLGGHDNIKILDNCATRLRVTVEDTSKVIPEKIKEARAIAVVVKGSGVQAIYGGEVQNIKIALEAYWKRKN